MQRTSKKLNSLRYGHFEITMKVSENDFKLKFPPYMTIMFLFMDNSSIIGLIVGLSIWFLSTPNIFNILDNSQQINWYQKNWTMLDPFLNLQVKIIAPPPTSYCKSVAPNNQKYKRNINRKNMVWKWRQGIKIPTNQNNVGGIDTTKNHRQI